MLVGFISLPVNRLLLVPASVSLSLSVYCVFACLCLLFLSSPVFLSFSESSNSTENMYLCVSLPLPVCVVLSLVFFNRLSRCCLSLGGRMVSSHILIPQK